MRQKSVHPESSSERIVKTIRRATRKRHSSEEKIQIVLYGLRGESNIAELCRREGIAEGRPSITLGRRSSWRPASGGCARSPSLHLYEELPDVPTVAESGYTGYEAILWTGMLAPAKTSKDMIAGAIGCLSERIGVWRIVGAEPVCKLQQPEIRVPERRLRTRKRSPSA
jgi:transposase-like protein